MAGFPNDSNDTLLYEDADIRSADGRQLRFWGDVLINNEVPLSKAEFTLLRDRKIAVSSYATGGSGTYADPWTGWEAPALAALAALPGGFGVLYHRSGYYKRTTTGIYEIPRDCRVDGDGYDSCLISNTAGTFVSIRNSGWATSTPAANIEISGIRVRHEAVLAGNEGPYSSAINLRSITRPLVHDVTLEGNFGGIQMEGCIGHEVADCYGYRQGDVSFRNNWSGTLLPSADGAHWHDCRSADAGYQLLDGSALPEPSGPVGSAVLCTQSDVKFSDIIVHNSRRNSFESGGGCSGIVLEDWHTLVSVAGRNTSILLSDIKQATVSSVKARMTAAGTCRVYISGASGAGQDDILVENVKATWLNPTAEAHALLVGAYSTNVVVRGITSDGLLVATSSVTSTDIEVKDCTVRNAYRMAYNFASNVRLRASDLIAINPGLAVVGATERVGFVFDGVTSSSARRLTAEDTRAGGARTMQHGFYINGGSLEWGDNASINSVSTPLTETNSPTKNAPIEIARVDNVITKTGAYTITDSDSYVIFNLASGSAVLPTAVGRLGRIFRIKNINAVALPIGTTSAQTIDGAAPGTIAQWGVTRVMSDGANWITV